MYKMRKLNNTSEKAEVYTEGLFIFDHIFRNIQPQVASYVSKAPNPPNEI